MLSFFFPTSFGLLFCTLVLGCRSIHTLNYGTEQSVVPGFYLGVCFRVTFLIVDPWQSCVCFKRSGITRCTLLMVLYLDCMCQCGLHSVLWSHIGTLIHSLAAEPCSTARLLFPSQCPSGTIFLTPNSMVWDWRVSREGPMLLYWTKQFYPYYIVFYTFSLFLLSVYRLVLFGWDLRTDRVYITFSQPCTDDLFY